MADYFVSSAGSDSNPGTYSSPWKTIDRVNTAIGSGGVIGVKNRIRFRRGDTFYGGLRPSTSLDATSPGWLRIGAYGDGAAPIISGYKVLNTASGWTAYDANTWQLNYSSANVDTTYTGNSQASEYDGVPTVGADVAFLKVDGVIKGSKKSSLGALASQWDFFSAGTVLYVRSTAKPTTLCSDIRCAIRLDGATYPSCVEIADLTIEGFGGNGAGTGTCDRARVLRCTIREIGGSYLTGSTTRYGNGLATWNNVKNILLEYNTISDVYDCAWSPQGTGTGTYFTDITFRRNLTYRCSQAEEYTYFAGTGPGFVNVRSEYNTHLFSGYGFGSERTATDQLAGLTSYQWGDSGSGYVGDVTLRRNIFWDCRSAYRHRANNYPPLGMASDYNLIALRPGTLMQNNETLPLLTSQTIETASAWATAVGIEQHSQFITLPASSDTDISDADMTAALASVKANARSGQVMATQASWT